MTRSLCAFEQAMGAVVLDWAAVCRTVSTRHSPTVGRVVPAARVASYDAGSAVSSTAIIRPAPHRVDRIERPPRDNAPSRVSGPAHAVTDLTRSGVGRHFPWVERPVRV